MTKSKYESWNIVIEPNLPSNENLRYSFERELDSHLQSDAFQNFVIFIHRSQARPLDGRDEALRKHSREWEKWSVFLIDVLEKGDYMTDPEVEDDLKEYIIRTFTMYVYGDAIDMQLPENEQAMRDICTLLQSEFKEKRGRRKDSTNKSTTSLLENGREISGYANCKRHPLRILILVVVLFMIIFIILCSLYCK